MQHVWSIVQRYMDDTGAKEAAVARKMGLSEQALNTWKLGRLKRIPRSSDLVRLADATNARYRDVLDAALLDWGYLPEGAARQTDAPPGGVGYERDGMKVAEARRSQRTVTE
jgi:transcriptional regulator with XRE-family HTH domain